MELGIEEYQAHFIEYYELLRSRNPDLSASPISQLFYHPSFTNPNPNISFHPEVIIAITQLIFETFSQNLKASMFYLCTFLRYHKIWIFESDSFLAYNPDFTIPILDQFYQLYRENFLTSSGTTSQDMNSQESNSPEKTLLQTNSLPDKIHFSKLLAEVMSKFQKKSPRNEIEITSQLLQNIIPQVTSNEVLLPIFYLYQNLIFISLQNRFLNPNPEIYHQFMNEILIPLCPQEFSLETLLPISAFIKKSISLITRKYTRKCIPFPESFFENEGFQLITMLFKSLIDYIISSENEALPSNKETQQLLKALILYLQNLPATSDLYGDFFSQIIPLLSCGSEKFPSYSFFTSSLLYLIYSNSKIGLFFDFSNTELFSDENLFTIFQICIDTPILTPNLESFENSPQHFMECNYFSIRTGLESDTRPNSLGILNRMLFKRPQETLSLMLSYIGSLKDLEINDSSLLTEVSYTIDSCLMILSFLQEEGSSLLPVSDSIEFMIEFFNSLHALPFFDDLIAYQTDESGFEYKMTFFQYSLLLLGNFLIPHIYDMINQDSESNSQLIELIQFFGQLFEPFIGNDEETYARYENNPYQFKLLLMKFMGVLSRDPQYLGPIDYFIECAKSDTIEDIYEYLQIITEKALKAQNEEFLNKVVFEIIPSIIEANIQLFQSDEDPNDLSDNSINDDSSLFNFLDSFLPLLGTLFPFILHYIDDTSITAINYIVNLIPQAILKSTKNADNKSQLIYSHSTTLSILFTNHSYYEQLFIDFYEDPDLSFNSCFPELLLILVCCSCNSDIFSDPTYQKEFNDLLLYAGEDYHTSHDQDSISNITILLYSFLIFPKTQFATIQQFSNYPQILELALDYSTNISYVNNAFTIFKLYLSPLDLEERTKCFQECVQNLEKGNYYNPFEICTFYRIIKLFNQEYQENPSIQPEFLEMNESFQTMLNDYSQYYGKISKKTIRRRIVKQESFQSDLSMSQTKEIFKIITDFLEKPPFSTITQSFLSEQEGV